MHLPVSLVDYVIVHELAHIGYPGTTLRSGLPSNAPPRTRPPPRPPRNNRHRPMAGLNLWRSQPYSLRTGRPGCYLPRAFDEVVESKVERRGDRRNDRKPWVRAVSLLDLRQRLG